MSPDSSVRPRDWSVPASDVLLADGTIAVIRSLRPDDRDQLLALHESVSHDTLRLRFFSPSPAAGRAYVAHLFDESNTESAALVAVVRGRIAALATAELLSDESAEVAFLVSDQDRGRGLGSLLLEHLAAMGREHGLSRFEAEVLADNYGMLGVFRAAGFAVSRRSQDGEVSVELRTEASAAVIEAADRREWRSEARSLRPLLYPAERGRRRGAPGGRRAGSRGPRRDPRGGLRRSAVRRAPGGGHRGRPARAPDAHVDRGAGRPRRHRGARRPRHRGHGRCLCRGRRRGDRGLVGARRRVRPRGARAAGAGPRPQRARGRTRLAGRAVVGGGSSAQHDVRPCPAGARWPGGRLAVRRGGAHAARPDPGPRGGRPLVRLARRQAGRLQQRPAGRLDGRRPGPRGRPPSRVVRQRHEVRPHRPPVRRAQAAAGGGRRPGRQVRRSVWTRSSPSRVSSPAAAPPS